MLGRKVGWKNRVCLDSVGCSFILVFAVVALQSLSKFEMGPAFVLFLAHGSGVKTPLESDVFFGGISPVVKMVSLGRAAFWWEAARFV